jgi:hypothetical protein
MQAGPREETLRTYLLLRTLCETFGKHSANFSSRFAESEELVVEELAEDSLQVPNG